MGGWGGEPPAALGGALESLPIASKELEGWNQPQPAGGFQQVPSGQLAWGSSRCLPAALAGFVAVA